MARVVVGVDAGGTGTSVALAHDGNIVRRAQGARANASTVGIDNAADAIVRAIREVANHETLDAIYVGAAGAGRRSVAEPLHDLIHAAFSRARIAVSDDAAIALRASAAHGPALVLIAGTGSVALADDGEQQYRVGGLGYLLGDEGSAAWIGVQAMRLLGRVYDGRAPRDETSDLVARHLGATSRDMLLAIVYGEQVDVARIAALAPSIIAFAGKGNRASTKIVQEAAKELGELLKAAARIGGVLDRSPTVGLAGGLMSENSMLTFLLETRIAGDIPGAAVVRGIDPVVGAVRFADELALG